MADRRSEAGGANAPCKDSHDRQLTEKEQVYLNAVQLNQKHIVEELMNDPDVDPCCVDFMGRSALILSISAGNIDLIDMLLYRLEKKNFSAIEDALLYAVSLEKTHIVKLIIDHPSYILNEKTYALVRSRLGQVHRSEERQRLPKLDLAMKRPSIQRLFTDYSSRKYSTPQDYRKFRMQFRRSQFSPDITPLMLAAHRNNHEIVQLFLSRGQNIDPPHLDICSCLECKAQREDDSLMFERSRLNTYRAFASPAFMALTFNDPVKEAFALAQTLRQYSRNHKEFKEEYIHLSEQCMNFAIEIMNLCRSAKEVGAMLSGLTKEKNRTVIDPLAVIKDALKYGEKDFISHPNCQMHCMKYFYQQLAFIQHLHLGAKIALLLMFAPLILPLSLLYIVYPKFQIIVPKVGHSDSAITIPVRRLLHCPAVKFLSHSLSYIFFLCMLIWATFRAERMRYSFEDSDTSWEEKADLLWQFDIRDPTKIVSALQWCILGWLFGHFWMECKEIYNLGAHNYLESYYNVLDSLSMMLYMASFACRIVAAQKVSQSHATFESQLKSMGDLLFNNVTFFGNETNGKEQYKKMRYSLLMSEEGYWLRGCRSWWHASDPEIVSDCCFAIANWLSFARATFMMLAWEALGPLQISLSRMVAQIARFITILVLFLLAFVVAMTNLYWYYAKDIEIINASSPSEFHVRAVDNNRMGNLRSTLMNLYWTLFGMTESDITITLPHAIMANESTSFYFNEDYTVKTATQIMDTVGTLMFATYTGFMIIILMNMLIATMSHQYEVVQTAANAEWRYARCKLWMWYIDQEGCLPVPLNLIPTAKTYRNIKRFLLDLFSCNQYKPQRRDDSHSGPQIAKRFQYNPQSFADALEGAKKKAGLKQEDVIVKLKSNLRRRFLFHLQGMREEKVTDERYQQLDEADENAVTNPDFRGIPGDITLRRTPSAAKPQPPASPEILVRPTGSVIFGVIPKDALNLPPANEPWRVAPKQNDTTVKTKGGQSPGLSRAAHKEDATVIKDESKQASNEDVTAKTGSTEPQKQSATSRSRTIERLLMPASMRKRFLGSEANEREDTQTPLDKRGNKARWNSERSATTSDAMTGSVSQGNLTVKSKVPNRYSAPVYGVHKDAQPQEPSESTIDQSSSKPPPIGLLSDSAPPYPQKDKRTLPSATSATPVTLPSTSSSKVQSPTNGSNCPYPLADIGVPSLPDTAIDVVASNPGHGLGTVFEEGHFGYSDAD